MCIYISSCMISISMLAIPSESFPQRRNACSWSPQKASVSSVRVHPRTLTQPTEPPENLRCSTSFATLGFNHPRDSKKIL